jgi:hypothetical protein
MARFDHLAGALRPGPSFLPENWISGAPKSTVALALPYPWDIRNGGAPEFCGAMMPDEPLTKQELIKTLRRTLHKEAKRDSSIVYHGSYKLLDKLKDELEDAPAPKESKDG